MLRKFLILASVISLAMFAGCDASVCTGGSDGIACYTDIAAVTAASPSATITGAIEAPEVSVSISKSISSVSKAVASGVTGHVYTLEGEDCGEFTTDSDGAFTITCPVATLKATTALKIEANNGVQKIVAIAVTDDTTEVSAGTADMDDTLAAAMYQAEDIGSSDISCWIESMKATFRMADKVGEGVNPTFAVLKEAINDFAAGGHSPSEMGYSTWGDFYSAVMKGTADPTALAAIVNVDGLADNYSDAVVIAQAHATRAERESDPDGSCNQSTAAGSISKSIDTALCSNADANDAVAKALLNGDVLVSQTVNNLTVDDDYYVAWCRLRENCIANETCADFNENALDDYGSLAAYEMNFGEGLNASDFAEQVRTAEGCAGGSRSASYECGYAVQSAMEYIGYGLLDAVDKKTIYLYYSAQVAAAVEFNAALEDYTTAIQLTNGTNDASGDCVAGKSSDTEWKNCFTMGAILLGTCSGGCPAGQVCNPNNACGTCTSDEQCKAYINQVLHTAGIYECSNGTCIVADSAPADPVVPECTTGAQCPLASPAVVGHQLCLNTECAQCGIDVQCAAAFGAGYRCRGAVGNLACISATECFVLGDCSGGQLCLNSGSCGACTNNASCSAYGAGFTCQSGLCSNVPPPECSSALNCGVTPLPPGKTAAYKLCVVGSCSFCTTNLQCTGGSGPGVGYACEGPVGNKGCVNPPTPPPP